MQKIILQNAFEQKKKQIWTWGLIRAWELNYSGKYGTFKFKM